MKTQNRKRLSIQIVTSLLVFLVVLVLGTSHKAQAEPVKMRMGRAGIELLKNFEGCSLKAYKPLPTEKYYTIGYGHYGPDVKEDMVITKEQAEEMLKEDLVEYADYVNDFLNKNKLTVTQSQFDALTSFTYNLGDVWKYANRCRLRDYLIDGIDKYSEKEIREAFTAWNRAGGQVLAGLTKRRNAEADLFFSNFDTGYYEVTAQSLNIRMGPEKYYKQIGARGKGSQIYVSETAGKWGKTLDGWMSLEYCKKITKVAKAPTGYILQLSSLVVDQEKEVLFTILPKDKVPIASYRLYICSNGVEKEINLGSDNSYSMSFPEYDGIVQVYASISNSKGTYKGSTDKDFVSVTVNPMKPKLTNIVNGTAGVILQWEKMEGAAKYRVMRKTVQGKWTKVADTEKLTITDRTIKQGEIRTYTVRGLNQNNKMIGSYEKEGLQIRRLLVPKLTEIEHNVEGIKLSWEGNEHAQGYFVYRKAENGKWKRIAVIADANVHEYTDASNLKRGVYVYTVKAYHEEDVSASDLKGKSILIP